MIKLFLLIAYLSVSSIFATDLLYKKNYINPSSAYEILLLKHTAISYQKTLQQLSSLNNTEFAKDRICLSQAGVIPFYHFLNNICSLKNAAHLQIGLYKGGSFVSALCNNEINLTDKIGIDIYSDDRLYNHETICKNVCKKYLMADDYQIIVNDCFKVNKSLFKNPIDIYLYDADHSSLAHEMAFTYYDDIFANVFIAIVDDWGWEQVREGTFRAFDKLGYNILYENIIPGAANNGTGQYIVIIKRVV